MNIPHDEYPMHELEPRLDSIPHHRFLECLKSCLTTCSVSSLITRLLFMAGLGFLAMAVPCLILIKYETRLASLSTCQHQGDVREPMAAEAEIEPLPFELEFGPGAKYVMDTLHLSVLIRTFSKAMHRAAVHVSGPLILTTACVPAAGYYFILVLFSRFAADQVRSCQGLGCRV